MDLPPIILEVDYTPKDVQEFMRAHSKRQARTVKWVVWGVTLAMMLLVMQMTTIAWRTPVVAAPVMRGRRAPPPSTTWTDSLFSLWPTLAAVAFVIVLSRFLRRWLVKRALGERNALQRHHVIEISPTNLSDTEPLARHVYEWGAFNRWIETSNLLLLYVAANAAIPIPKRAFASPAEVEQCRDLLRAMIDTPRTARNAFPVQTVGSA